MIFAEGEVAKKMGMYALKRYMVKHYKFGIINPCPKGLLFFC